MSFIVMCRVSGGVTGTRESELKESDPNNPGKVRVRYFGNREEADTAAKRENDRPRSPYSTADFRYWVEAR